MKQIIVILLSLTTFGLGAQDDLNKLVKKHYEKYRLPGIAVGIVRSDTILMNFQGVEALGTDRLIDQNSKFQLSSNSKAITASIAAQLVKEGVLSWSTQLLELIPTLSKNIRPDYRSITLADLLSQRVPLPPFEDTGSPEWRKMPNALEASENPKLAFAQYALQLKPIKDQQSHYYSNGSYIIAGLLLEVASGQNWDTLVNNFGKVWECEMTVGFPDEIPGQTRGHIMKGGQYQIASIEKESPIHHYFSPAGNLSIDLGSHVRFIQAHLSGLQGKDQYLSADEFQFLHYKYPDYGLGWYHGKVGDTTERFSYHGGSIGTYTSSVLLSADRDLAIVILMNADGAKANKAKNELREALWDFYKK